MKFEQVTEVTMEDGKLYNLESDSGHKYHVVIGPKQSCTCPDWQFRKKKLKQKCKHMLAIVEHEVKQSILQSSDWSFSWGDEDV